MGGYHDDDDGTDPRRPARQFGSQGPDDGCDARRARCFGTRIRRVRGIVLRDAFSDQRPAPPQLDAAKPPGLSPFADGAISSASAKWRPTGGACQNLIGKMLFPARVVSHRTWRSTWSGWKNAWIPSSLASPAR